MARRSRVSNPDRLRKKLVKLLTDFEDALRNDELREQVKALIPAREIMHDLGSSLCPSVAGKSARDRILAYLRKYPGEVVDGQELMVVAGISEYGRRIRELRVEHGWPILSGHAARDLRDTETSEEDLPPDMKPDQYLLLEDRQDQNAARRWKLANEIRRDKGAVQEKILKYLRNNVGQPVTGEELRYVANNKSEWARRIRELRTEEGWRIVTRFNGNPKLPVGVYILATDQQGETHDRHIKELTRRQVMQRDAWRCRWHDCGWSKDRYDRDPRYLEVHHIKHHVEGGSNDPENLVTLCNLHHDETHRSGVLDIVPIS